MKYESVYEHMPVVTDFTALLSGLYWNGIEVTGRPAIVTYSFPSIAPGYLSSVDGFTAATISSFQAFTPAMQAQARAALVEWSAASGLVFLEVAPGQGDINFQLVNFNTTPYGGAGIAFYPFGNWSSLTYPYFTTSLDASGDVFMDTQDVSAGAVNYGTLLHEIGHAIGLKHPTELVFNGASGVAHYQVLSADDPALTIMATVGENGGGTPALKPLDKAAAAALYGPAGEGGVYTTSTSGANSASSWSFNAATQTVTQAGFATDDMIRGTSVADLIEGLDGDDTLSGLAGNDTLIGGAGHDNLFGGQGINRLVGGQGNDLYLLENATDAVIENLNEGDDIVFAGFSYTLRDNVERLQLIGAGQIGTGNTLANTIYGNGARSNILKGMAGADYILGGSLNDVIDGGTEADTMWGLTGNDSYSVDNAGDFVGEYLGEGTDSVTASISYTLTDHVEKLTLTGSTAINGTGNTLANTITGNTGANVLNGGNGNDTLTGGGGNDTLIGGAGNDSYLFDADVALGSDTLDEAGGGSDTLNFSATTTRSIALNLGVAPSQVVNSNLSLTLGSATTFENVIGGALDDTLIGNALANRLTGGAGNDTLAGGAGNDTLIGGLGGDTFRFDASLNASTNRDAITDFSIDQGDTIELVNAIFTALPIGPLADSAFLIGTAAITASQRILYNSATGSLSYDADGNGAATAMAFATLTRGLALSSSQFSVI
jgi:Ca2+-binding RTX toxin-like protein